MHRHVLISASYESDSAMLSRDLTRIVREGFEEYDFDLEQIMSYQMPYSVTPMQAGLKDAWMAMTDEDRDYFAKIFPGMAFAILTMLGLESPGGVEGEAERHEDSVANS